MQRQGVIESRTARVLVFLNGLHPALKHRGVIIHWRTVEAQQGHRQPFLIHQRRVHAAVFLHFFQESTEHAVVTQHQVLREAQFLQIIEQIALVTGWLVEIFMRWLTAAGAQ